jgi:hypothetical protein
MERMRAENSKRTRTRQRCGTCAGTCTHRKGSDCLRWRKSIAGAQARRLGVVDLVIAGTESRDGRAVVEARNRRRCALGATGWSCTAGLGWAGVGWGGLGWAGVGWGGLGWAGPGWAGPGWVCEGVCTRHVAAVDVAYAREALHCEWNECAECRNRQANKQTNKPARTNDEGSFGSSKEACHGRVRTAKEARCGSTCIEAPGVDLSLRHAVACGHIYRPVEPAVE